MKKKIYCIQEFCEHYGISRSHFYRQIHTGRLRVTKRGHRTFIKPAAAEHWFKTAPYNQTRKALAYCSSLSPKRGTRRRKNSFFKNVLSSFFGKRK